MQKKRRLQKNKIYKEYMISQLAELAKKIKTEELARKYFGQFYKKETESEDFLVNKISVYSENKNELYLTATKDNIHIAIAFEHSVVNLLLLDGESKIETKQTVFYSELKEVKYNFVFDILNDVLKTVKPIYADYLSQKDQDNSLFEKLNSKIEEKRPEAELNSLISALGIDEDAELKEGMKELISEAKSRQKIKEKVKS